MDSSLDWIDLISVDPQWVNDFLISHTSPPASKGKIVTRVYSIRFSSNSEGMDRLVSYMRNKLPHYTYSKQEIKELVDKGIEPWPEARDNHFGKVDPTSDGKCGEMLLYMLVEAILQTPMIAHKIKCTRDNPRTQVHGSDGVFIGEYNGMECLLLGEAKMHQTQDSGLNDALKSVNTFYDPTTSGQTIRSELVVVRDFKSKSITKKQLQYLEEVLNLQSEKYSRVTKVHPILIVYDESKIKEIEIASKDAPDGEERERAEFQLLGQQVLTAIADKISSKWRELERVYLDFFFIPVTSIDKFRASFYTALWGSKPKTRKKRKRKQRAK